MLNCRLTVWSYVIFLIMFTCLHVHAQAAAPVKIEFEADSKRIDLLTEKNLPDYKEAEKGSFRFFTGRLDEPETVVYYFHDGRRSVDKKNLRSMEKYNRNYAQWKLRFTSGRRDVPQYIPRIHTLAVSFIPLNPSTGKPEKRVYVLLDDLKLIDWGEKL